MKTIINKEAADHLQTMEGGREILARYQALMPLRRAEPFPPLPIIHSDEYLSNLPKSYPHTAMPRAIVSAWDEAIDAPHDWTSGADWLANN